MCYGKTWSLVSFSTIAAVAAFGIYKKISIRIVLPLIFLAAKELLQFILYFYLADCNQTNQILTTLSWIHISFQPLFVLLFISAFTKRQKLYDVPLGLALIYGIFNTLMLREFRPKSMFAKCYTYEKNKSICRPKTCSIMGETHLAYGFNISSADVKSPFNPTFFVYGLLTLAVPYLIGDWQLATVNLIVASIIFSLNIYNIGEKAALWCVNTLWIAPFTLYYIFYGNPFK